MRRDTASFKALVLFFAHLANAHLKLEQPVPYGVTSLNTEPLEPTGADWPCKQRPGGYDITKWNIMPIGSNQTMSFQGQATHGGGSCQISLTKDTPPTTQSVFKVIKSIEGGCPSTNPGNVGTDPFGYGADKFTFTIPDAIAPANYTLAWTWFNKIGNREMYMNCAPVTVVVPASKLRRHSRCSAAAADLRQRTTSTTSTTDGLSALPDIFRANSGNGCETPPSGTVLAIPPENLGTVVQRIGSEPLAPPVGDCGGGTAAPAEDLDHYVGTEGGGGGSQSAIAPTAETSVGASSVSAGSSGPASSAATPVPAVISSAAPASAEVSQLVVASPVAGVTTGFCATPGRSVCSPDGEAWGTCMGNHQVLFQPVAVGTKCDSALGVEVPARMG